MGFYTGWWNILNSGKEQSDYIPAFLSSTKEAVEPLINGADEELEAAYNVLMQIPTQLFLDVLAQNKVYPKLTPADVPCFSDMKNGSSRLNELLSFYPDGLSFSEIGYQLMNSETDAAQKKYGENQSKLAAIMSLVYLDNQRPIKVHATALGEYLTRYDYSEKKAALQKLVLRDPCVKHLLCKALNGPVRYADVVSFLKDSTKRRRRTNVRFLVAFVLEGTDRELLLSNIDWEL